MSRQAQCAQVRGWMTDAASGSLSESRRGQFAEHVSDCAACRAELQHMENLLGKTDQNLRTALAVEPSPQLLVTVRQNIAAESQHAPRAWFERNPWFSVAATCVTLAIFLLAAVALHRANQPPRDYTPRPATASPASTQTPATPIRSTSESTKNTSPAQPFHKHARNPELALAHRQRPRNPRRVATEMPEVPEVIVQPGQMAAIFQFVAEVQKGKINGEEIEKAIHAAQKPLQIMPLDIAPLETSTDDTVPDPAAKSREPGSANGRLE